MAAEVESAEIRKMIAYRKAGMTYAQIGSKLARSEFTVLNYLKQAGLDGLLEKPIEPPIPDREYRDLLASHGETPDSVPYYHQLLSKETLTRHLTRR